MAYNDLFERLVDRDDNKVRGYIAYGFYKAAKREWIRQQTDANAGQIPTPEQIAHYSTTYTQVSIEGLRAQADQALVAFASDVVADARPEIVENTLKGSFGKSLWTGIVTNLVYTLILLVLVAVLARAGVDILSLAVPPQTPK